ncbi:hypothetical protein AYI70_g11381 [Smittium culicis]|uniref:Reverse transcriptase domain-containing protein n=1 Tax=Smittium culicis TaxID=133412 RepID=A0A1R1X255_9FUNG|nr:hypothetical protein AYI70_g11381 [Smittium culicis]
MMKGVYDAPKIVFRVGNEVSKATEYPFEVHQGCPASPILFDFFISNVFKGVRGVRMPGLTSRIPRLLFAVDSVLLAESSADLQDLLDTITIWSNTWEMAVNASKCVIMTISGDLTADMTLQGPKVDSTDQYTILGYIMNSKWDVSGAIKNMDRRPHQVADICPDDHLGDRECPVDQKFLLSRFKRSDYYHDS